MFVVEVFEATTQTTGVVPRDRGLSRPPIFDTS
jgi:hypothetical protein